MMTFLKLTKGKSRLFLSMIAASFIAGILFMLVNRFLITNYYLTRPSLITFFISIFQFIVIAYLTLAFYKKKLVLHGKYYTIFKIAFLLIIFNFLYQLFFSWVIWQIPITFFPAWLNVLMIIINLAGYYLLSCVIYNFDN